MSQITLQNAEKSWTEILRKALEGEETIIERDGKPVAKVSPVKADEDWFGMDNGKIWIADDFDETPQEIIDAFEGKKLDENFPRRKRRPDRHHQHRRWISRYKSNAGDVSEVEMILRYCLIHKSNNI